MSGSPPPPSNAPTPQASSSSQSPPRNLGDVLREFADHQRVMREELSKVIIGQSETIEQLLAAIFTRGHCLLEGVPGLAKTLMVSIAVNAAPMATLCPARLGSLTGFSSSVSRKSQVLSDSPMTKSRRPSGNISRLVTGGCAGKWPMALPG